MPNDVAATVRNLLALIPSVEIISEPTCTKSKMDLGTDVVLTGNNGNGADVEDASPIIEFIEKCKEVALKIGELNGEKISFRPKGKEIKYTFKFNAEGCCDLLEDIISDDEGFDCIEDYLKGTQKPTGITTVLPFMGKILDQYLFSNQQSFHKTSVEEKLKEIYPEGSIVNYLSYNGRKRSEKLKQLYLRAVDIALKKGLTSLN